MKKFKHKQTGEIATYNDGVLKSSGFCVEIGIEPSDKYWEEIKEVVQKEYEILSYRRKDKGTCIHNKYHKPGFIILVPPCNVRFPQPETGSVMCSISPEYWCSPRENCEIYSIKRLSDGEIFTIGDACHLNNGNYYKSELKEFKFFTNGEHGHLEKHRNKTFLKVGIQSCHSDKPTFFYLESIVKAKELLFKTEDGVDIHVNQYSYGVHLPTMKFTGDYIWRYKEHFSSNSLSKETKYFSTEEKAKEFIIMNKPCLSINEINFLKTEGFCFWDSKLKELVKSKI